MTLSKTAGNRFRFEPLEERIAPGCLFLGACHDPSELSDAIARPEVSRIANVNPFERLATFFGIAGTEANQPRFALTVSRAKQEGNTTIACELPCGSDVAEHRTDMPRWAEDLLGEIDRRLDCVKTSEERAVAPRSAVELTFIDDLLAKIEDELNSPGAPQPAAPPKTRDIMPTWAENLLGEIHQQFNERTVSSRSARNSRRAGHFGSVDEILSKIDREFLTPSAKPQLERQLPSAFDR